MSTNIWRGRRRPAQDPKAAWSQRRVEVIGSTDMSLPRMLLIGAVVLGFVALNVAGICLVQGVSGAKSLAMPVHTLSAD